MIVTTRRRVKTKDRARRKTTPTKIIRELRKRSPTRARERHLVVARAAGALDFELI